MKFIRLLEYLFGCRHLKLSRVFTIDKQTYRVCCQCGAEFDYSLATMSIKRQRTPIQSGDPQVEALTYQG